MNMNMRGVLYLLFLASFMITVRIQAEETAAGDESFYFTPKEEAGIISEAVWHSPEEDVMDEYTLGPDDAVGVEVDRHPEFSGLILITKAGGVTFPLDPNRNFLAIPEYKDLRPVGMTEKELAEVIRLRLTRYLYEPRVTVSVIDYGSKKYYVVGEVGRPGRYQIRGSRMEIKDAIFEAGLTTPFAALRRARIIKPAKEKPVIKKVNLYALLYKGDLKHNLYVEPGDIIYVPSTVAVKINFMLEQIISPASQTNALQRLYYQYDTEYYKNLFQYDEWYYKSRPGYSR